MAADEAVTREELVSARADIQRQIETLQTPARSYNQFLNGDMIARLRNMITEIDEQLATWKD